MRRRLRSEVEGLGGRLAWAVPVLVALLGIDGEANAAPEPVPLQGIGTLERQIAGFPPGELPYEAELVGSEKCGACHVEHYRGHDAHHMANTGSSVDAKNHDDWFPQDRLAKSVLWPEGLGPPPSYVLDPDGVLFVAPIGGDRDRVERVRVEAVIGSGARGFTPISGAAGRAIRELRLSYSARHDSWFMTPGAVGHPDPLGALQTAEGSRDCLQCHGTLLVWREDRLDFAASRLGVQCERCHGPGSAHVDAVSRSADESLIFNPGTLTTERQVTFCAQCHREPSDLDPVDVMSRNPTLSRHAGAGLMLSACFRRMRGERGISCSDCHDPHRNLPAESESESERYQGTCLRCHRSPELEHVSSVITASADCISCHMPVEERGFYGLRFTDHWIRRPDSPAPLDSSERDEYLEYLEEGYRRAALRTDLGPEKSAQFRIRLGEALFARQQYESSLRALEEGLSFSPSYPERLRAATLFRRAELPERAATILDDAIRAEPDLADAYFQRGELFQQQGELDQAAARYRRSLEIRPDFAGAHNSLGSVLGNQGKLNEAVGHFRRAIALNPQYAEAHQNLGLSLRMEGRTEEALARFRDALALRPTWPAPHDAVARILATAADPQLRNPEEAIRLAERAAELTRHGHPAILETLAAAYASAGRFDEAVAVAEAALRIAETHSDGVAEQIRSRLELYRAERPFIERP